MARNRAVFISHNRADKPFARKLRAELMRAGIDVWLDENEIAAGNSITEQVSVALDKSAAFLLVLSPAAMNAPWVKREMWSSLYRSLSRRDCEIIPVLRTPCDIPSIISDVKYIDFTRGFGMGITQLHERLKDLGLQAKPGGVKPTKSREQLVVLRWEVDIDIANARGDATYQVGVSLLNNLRKRISLGPMHSFWTSGTPAVAKQISAFDASGTLKPDLASMIREGTAMSFCFRPNRPIQPGRVWNYCWEVPAKKAWSALRKQESYTYRGETPVRELVVKLRLPPGMKGRGQAQCRWDSGSVEKLPWVVLHGRAAILYRRIDVPAGQNMSIVLRAK